MVSAMNDTRHDYMFTIGRGGQGAVGVVMVPQ